MSNWWIKTMRYIREEPGTIYNEQLKNMVEDLTNKTVVNVVDYLNNNTPHGVANRNYLKKHPNTGEVYTAPEERKYLDAEIAKADSEYLYNEYLYLDTFPNNGYKKLNKKDIENCKNDNDDLIFFDFRKFSKNEKVIVSWNEFFSVLEESRKGKNTIGGFCAENVIFEGKVDLTFPEKIKFTKGICFRRATFKDNITLKNIDFDFSNNEIQDGICNAIDFRDARFFESVTLQDITFSGNLNNAKVTFEDARISKNITIQNVDFSSANLVCFQMVVGSYSNNNTTDARHKISVINSCFSQDSKIDFIDARIDNSIVKFENISVIPNTDLCFEPVDLNLKNLVCPDIKLSIKNCGIYGILKLSNISELSFENTMNFGKIIEAPNWAEHRPDKKYLLKTRGIGRTKIKSKILLAVYNGNIENENGENIRILRQLKAKDFLMLKENFASTGMYDSEDAAFILYMEHKPALEEEKYIHSHYQNPQCKSTLEEKYKDNDQQNHQRKNTLEKAKYKFKEFTLSFVYKILYALGKYGISPLRVICSMVLSVLAFSFVYYALTLIMGAEGVYSLTGGNKSFLLENIVGSFLGALIYSAGSFLPFASQFQPANIVCCIVSIFENFIGTFLAGYFSVAVIRKTLR